MRSTIVLVVGQTFRKTRYQNDVFIVSSNFIRLNILRRTSEDELSEDLSETMMTLIVDEVFEFLRTVLLFVRHMTVQVRSSTQ